MARGGTGQISLNNFITLGDMTVGNYAASVAGTTNEIEVTGSAGEGSAFTIGLPNDVTIAGNLTVNGSITTVDTTNLVVEDPLIKLAKTNNGADSVMVSTDCMTHQVHKICMQVYLEMLTIVESLNCLKIYKMSLLQQLMFLEQDMQKQHWFKL